MRFVTLFLKTENVHLTKDVGMIPYYLFRNKGYDSSIATYENGEYEYLNREVQGLRLDFVKRTIFGPIIDGIRYLKENAEDIDVLNIYHLNLASYFYEIAYRKYNPDGIIYLKLDMNPVGFINCFRNDPRGFIKRRTIQRCDIASVETTVMQYKLAKHYGDKIIYLPNGCLENYDTVKNCISAKQNVILTVSNLGTVEKATDVLLEAYADYFFHAKSRAYDLRLVGSIEKGFEKYIENYFKKYPVLREHVTFTGPIRDKLLLLEEYKRAKVFVLPSLSESFGIVLVEAALCGCYLITTDMVPAGFDITDQYKYGSAVTAGSSFELARAMVEATNERRDYVSMGIGIINYVRRTFNWNNLIARLDGIFQYIFYEIDGR